MWVVFIIPRLSSFMRNRIINPDPDRVILTQSLDEELPIFIVFRTVEHFMCLQEARG
jgi:hypothetical protein